MKRILFGVFIGLIFSNSAQPVQTSKKGVGQCTSGKPCCSLEEYTDCSEKVAKCINTLTLRLDKVRASSPQTKAKCPTLADWQKCHQPYIEKGCFNAQKIQEQAKNQMNIYNPCLSKDRCK